MQYGLTLSEVLWQQEMPSDGAVRMNSWEMGRLVLAQDYRNGQDVLKHCLFLALSHLCEHASAQNLHASCTSTILSRLYRKFGFSILARNVPLHGTEKKYNLIQGAAFDVLRALRVS